MADKRVADKYIKRVGKYMQCPPPEKKRFLAGLEEAVRAAEAEEDLTLEELRARFGAPEDIAKALLDSGETVEYIKRKTGVRKIVVIAVAAILAVLLFAVAVELIDNHRQANGYGKESVIEYITAYMEEKTTQ